MIMDQAYLSYINHSPARTMAAHLQNKFIPIKADDVVLNVEGAHVGFKRILYNLCNNYIYYYILLLYIIIIINFLKLN